MTTQDAREQLVELLKKITGPSTTFISDRFANAVADALLTDDALPLLINAIGKDRLLNAMGGKYDDVFDDRGGAWTFPREDAE